LGSGGNRFAPAARFLRRCRAGSSCTSSPATPRQPRPRHAHTAPADIGGATPGRAHTRSTAPTVAHPDHMRS